MHTSLKLTANKVCILILYLLLRHSNRQSTPGWPLKTTTAREPLIQLRDKSVGRVLFIQPGEAEKWTLLSDYILLDWLFHLLFGSYLPLIDPASLICFVVHYFVLRIYLFWQPCSHLRICLWELIILPACFADITWIVFLYLVISFWLTFSLPAWWFRQYLTVSCSRIVILAQVVQYLLK